MKLSMPCDAFYNRLSALSKTLGTSNKNSSTILNCFLFQVNDNSLTITASDSENTMKTTMPLVDSDSNGTFAINAQRIMNAARDLADQPITLTIDEETRYVTLSHSNGLYNFVADNADAYPQPMMPDGEITTKTIPSQLLAETLEHTVYATADDQIRLVMNGVYFDFLADYAVLVATDGHKLVRNKILSIQSETPTSFILPKKPAMLLKNSLNKDETDVTIQFDKQKAVITFDANVLICRLIEGRYPNYNSVIPNDNPYSVIVDRKGMLNALKRVLPFANESSQLVKLEVADQEITVKSEDLEFATKAVEKIPCSYTGNKLMIGFKGSGLQMVLTNLAYDELCFQMADPSRPALISPAEQPENQDILTLLMPMLLND